MLIPAKNKLRMNLHTLERVKISRAWNSLFLVLFMKDRSYCFYIFK